MDFKKIACEKDCRFSIHGMSETCAYYPPQYDKNGVNQNPDRNIQTSHVACSVCGKQWRASKRTFELEYSFTEITKNEVKANDAD